MHYTDGNLTLIATASFVVTFIIGVWMGTKFGNKTVLPFILLGAAACYLRSISAPLRVEAIAAVSFLHVAAGAFTALLLGRGKSNK